MGKTLSSDQITQLLALANKPRTPRERKKKDVRDYDTWFDLEHVSTESCQIDDHENRVNGFDFEDLELYEKALNRKRMVAEINGKFMCRYCYLSGAEKLVQ